MLQTYAALIDPNNLVEELLKQRTMAVENNSLARWVSGNVGVAKNGKGQTKCVKETRGKGVVKTERIDPITEFVFRDNA